MNLIISEIMPVYRIAAVVGNDEYHIDFAKLADAVQAYNFLKKLKETSGRITLEHNRNYSDIIFVYVDGVQLGHFEIDYPSDFVNFLKKIFPNLKEV